MQSLVSSQHMLTGQHCHSLQHSCVSPSVQPLRSGVILSATGIAVVGPLARMSEVVLHPWLQAARDPFRQWSTAKPPIRKGTDASETRWELQPQHLPAFAGPSAVRSDALRRCRSDREGTGHMLIKPAPHVQVSGGPERPRLAVYRSNNHIYAQVDHQSDRVVAHHATSCGRCIHHGNGRPSDHDHK